jgi:Family of unknown function (DUF6088)
LRQESELNMPESIERQVLAKIKRSPRGTLYFADSFAVLGNPKSINKALERLVHDDELRRVAFGIYARPVMDAVIGQVLPSIEEIALAIAKRDKARIVPDGNYAMYKLGLTSQVPLNIVYYTDASARKIQIGNQTLTFKKASSKNLSFSGEISKLAILALRVIGTDLVTEAEVLQIRNLLQKEEPKHLQHDLQLAPAWIRALIDPAKYI